MPPRNEKRFEFRLGKRGLLLFAAGMSVLVFASFWVGLQMGRDMENPAIRISRSSPSGAEKGGTTAIAPAKAIETPPAGDEKAAAVSPGVAPVGQAASSGTVPPAQSAQAAVRPPVPSPAAAPSPPSGATAAQKGAAPPASATERAPAGSKDTAAEKKTAKATAPPAPVPGVATGSATPGKSAEPAKETGKGKESFSLQVASYKEKAKAEETAKKLGSLGFKPRVLAVDLPAKGRWYRIVVGGFESREAAQKAADRIAKKIQGASCIIRKI